MPNGENFGANFSIDISQLQKGLAQANRLIRESESEFKAAAAGMDDWTESQEGLEARIKHLNSATDIQRKKVEALQKQYDENVKKGIDPMSSSMVLLRTNINKEQAALAKNEKELENQTEALKNLGKETEDTAKNLEKAGDSALSFGDIVKGNVVADIIVGGIKALANGIKDMASSFKDATLEAAAYADTMLTLSTQTGLSTEQLQEYQYMSELIDVSLDTITGSMSKLIKNMTTAKKGTGDAADAFAALGVKITNTDGTLRNNQEVFNETIDALSKIENETQRDAYAMSIFGKSAQELNPLIAQGSEALAAFAKEAHDTGYVLEEDALGALGGVDDATQRLTRQFEAMKNNLVAKYAPQISEGLNKMSKKIDKGFDKLVDDVIPAVIDGFGWVADNWRGIAAGFTGIFSVFLTNKLANSLITTHKAAKTLFATIKAFNSTNPIGLIVTGISLLGGGLAALAVATRDEKSATEESIKANKDFIESMKDRQDAYYDVIEAAEATAAADLAELEQIEKLNKELSTLVDGKGKVKKEDEERVNFILNELNEAFGTEYKLIDGVIQGYKDLETQIDSVIEKKKAQILLEPLEAAYTEAIQNQAGAQKDLVQASKEHAEQLDVVAQKESELDALFDEVNEASKNHNYDLMSEIQLLIMEKERELEKEKELLAGREEAYSSAKSEMEEYFAAIEEYETAQGLVVSGKTEEAIDYMSKLSGAITEADKIVADSHLEFVEKLGKSAEDTRVYAEEMRKMYNEGVAGVTEDMVKTAEDAAATAQKEYERVGGGITDGIITGINSNSWRIITKVNSIVSSAVDSALAGIDGQVQAQVQSSYRNSALNNPMIPKMAEGGIVNRATLAVIGENGAEAVVPLGRSGHPMIHVKGEEDEKPKQPTVIVNQTNNYSQEKSRQEIYQTKVATKNIIKYALRGV